MSLYNDNEKNNEKMPEMKIQFYNHIFIDFLNNQKNRHRYENYVKGVPSN